MGNKERNRVAILSSLNEIRTPANSVRLNKILAAKGYNLSERTVRLYLKELDADDLTELKGNRRRITEKGLAELRASETLQRVGYLSARIQQLSYDMTFDVTTRTGAVVVNMSLVDPRHLAACEKDVRGMFAGGYTMGNLLAILSPGESLGDLTVPPNHLGICTACSINLNGVLLKHGVPTIPRFGGLLELRHQRPTRFVEIIHYDATSIAPLEVFVRSGMTNCLGVVRNGDGVIGGSFCELPEKAIDLAVQLADRVSTTGLGGFLDTGWPSQPLLEVPVSRGHVGVAMTGGLNPIAILEEKGYRIHSRSMAGLPDYDRMFHFDRLPAFLAPYL